MISALTVPNLDTLHESALKRRGEEKEEEAEVRHLPSSPKKKGHHASCRTPHRQRMRSFSSDHRVMHTSPAQGPALGDTQPLLRMPKWPQKFPQKRVIHLRSSAMRNQLWWKLRLPRHFRFTRLRKRWQKWLKRQMQTPFGTLNALMLGMHRVSRIHGVAPRSMVCVLKPECHNLRQDRKHSDLNDLLHPTAFGPPTTTLSLRSYQLCSLDVERDL